jgi:WD40 repeat protein
MRYKQQAFFALFIICIQLVLFSGTSLPAWGAEIPTVPISKVSIINDGYQMEVFLRFSPSGGELARIPQFGPVVLSDTTSYKKARTFSVGMRMVAYSSDGTKIASAEGTDGARVWDAGVQGKRIPSVSGEFYLIETPLKVLQAPSKDSTHRVFWTEFSPDGKRLITTQANGHVKVWNTSSWAVEDDLSLTDSEVRAAAFTPDSKTLVIGDVKGRIYHWSFESKTKIESALTREPLGAVLGIVFAPDGKTLVTCHQSKSASTVRIWNTSTWVTQIEEGFFCAAFSKDGKIVALGGRNINVMDPGSGKPIRTIELPETTLGELGPGFPKEPDADKKIPTQIRALAFSPDGKTLAAACIGPLRIVKMSSD